MSRADDGLRKLLQTYLPKPDWDWTVVETGGTHDGVPDSYWASPATRTSGWIECKATTGWTVDVRPHQVGWALRHARCGVRVTFAVRARGAGSAGGRGDALWLVRGSAAKELQELGLRLPEWAVLGRWYGPPRGWNWEGIGRILTGAPDDPVAD